jgi:hypothetical protein
MRERLESDSSAAIAAIHQTHFFKIQNVDWLVIFLLHTGHSQPLDSYQQTFSGE